MNTIEIHEFSTGIEVSGTKDNWWSEGFTGNWLNLTLDKIPESVRQEIAADLFELSEVAKLPKPAIIGREVKLENEEYSVLAVITQKTDEIGRSVAGTRYFLTKGLGKLNHLLTYQQSNRLTFNPFDKKEKVDYDYDTNKPINDLLRLLDNHEELIKNIVVPSQTTTNTGQRIPIKAIHQLAEKKAKELNQLVSWAYDVEGLKKPEYFQIIYPALSADPEVQTDQNFQKSLENVQQPQQQIGQEHEIKTTIKQWIHGKKPTPDEIKIISHALQDQRQYDDSFWKDRIFQDYTIPPTDCFPTSIGSYLLYGLIFPEDFPEFLSWMHQKSSANNKSEKKHYQDALTLSEYINSQLSDQDSAIKSKAWQGSELLITSPSPQQSDLNFLKDWLNLDTKGLWGGAYQESIDLVLKDIKRIKKNYEIIEQALKEDNPSNKDIRKMLSNNYGYQKLMLTQNFEESQIKSNILNKLKNEINGHKPEILSSKPWETITKDLINLIWYDNDNNQGNYQTLAKFFAEMVDSKNNSNSNSNSNTHYYLSAIFEVMSKGKLSTKLWKKCSLKKAIKGELKFDDISIIAVTRELAWWEILLKKVIEKIEKLDQWLFKPNLDSKYPLLWRYFVISAFILLLGIILFDILEISPKKLSKESLIGAKKFFATFRIRDNEENSKDEPDLFEELYKIPKDFSTHLKVDPSHSQDAIIQILQASGSSERTVTLTWNKDKKQWNKNKPQWNKAIKDYQQKVKYAKPDLKVEVNGLLRKGDDTDKRLRCEIIQKLQAEQKSIKGVTENKVKECAEKYGVQKITATDKTGSPANNRGTSTPSTATDWKATVKAIDALRDEFVNMGQDKSTVEAAISKKIAAGFSYAYKADNQDDWTPKIKKFQKENSIIETGFISQNDETYKALKCKVAKELELTDKVPDCPANSD